MTLPEFLTACLAEDQRVAEAATPGPWRYNPRKEWHTPAIPLAVQVPGEEYVACGPLESPTCVAATGPAEDGQSMDDAEFIAAHDPTRVLAEIAAKRTILELHMRPGYWGSAHQCPDLNPDPEAGSKGNPFCGTIMLLAQPYRDRPGWDASWEVEG